jgi:hypothetical protein
VQTRAPAARVAMIARLRSISRELRTGCPFPASPG